MTQKIREDRPSPEIVKAYKDRCDRRIAADKLIAQGVDRNSAMFRSLYSDI